MSNQTIHTVWLGPEMPPLAKACIDDWKKQGYSVQIWTEQNPLVEKWISDCRFSKECWDRSLYAFVSDYVRLKVLEHSGGLYLDADVTIQKDPFELFIDINFSVGFETETATGTALIYAKKESKILHRLIKFYEEDIYSSDLYIGPSIQSYVLFGLKCSELEKNKIHPKEFFFDFEPGSYPLDYQRNKNAYITHWYSNSWGKSAGIGFLKGKHKGFIGKVYEWQKQLFRQGFRSK